jgi:hypothetical protein
LINIEWSGGNSIVFNGFSVPNLIELLRVALWRPILDRTETTIHLGAVSFGGFLLYHHSSRCYPAPNKAGELITEGPLWPEKVIRDNPVALHGIEVTPYGSAFPCFHLSAFSHGQMIEAIKAAVRTPEDVLRVNGEPLLHLPARQDTQRFRVRISACA